MPMMEGFPLTRKFMNNVGLRDDEERLRKILSYFWLTGIETRLERLIGEGLGC